MKKRLTKMEKRKIEECVTNLLKKSGIDPETTPGFDVVKLAIKQGFQVGETSKLQFIDDGFMYVSKDKKRKLIGVNIDRSLEEKRFIVAHELAHFFLHYDKKKSATAVMFREHIKGKDKIENDADYFAACLLMPEESFRKHYIALQKKHSDELSIINSLQIIFMVPQESIERRIKEVC